MSSSMCMCIYLRTYEDGLGRLTAHTYGWFGTAHCAHIRVAWDGSLRTHTGGLGRLTAHTYGWFGTAHCAHLRVVWDGSLRTHTGGLGRLSAHTYGWFGTAHCGATEHNFDFTLTDLYTYIHIRTRTHAGDLRWLFAGLLQASRAQFRLYCTAIHNVGLDCGVCRSSARRHCSPAFFGNSQAYSRL